MSINSNFLSGLSRGFEGYREALLAEPGNLSKSFPSPLVQNTLLSPAVPQYSIQNVIRPAYGLGSPQAPSIGDHPDFISLRGTANTEYHAITTLFMDIEGSTRLSLFYTLDEVRLIKNAFITAAIEIVKSFDGHVHRIMGDAIMAYFGGKSILSENAVINGINAASVIQYFAEKVVRPFLNENLEENTFGIRIGLDYGSKDKVLWSSYGYPQMEEVTATSFYVDVAAKLQQSAGRNNIMIGQSLRDFLDFPEELLTIKHYQKDGESIPEPYIRPNYIDSEGNPINYRKYILNWRKYLSLSPISVNDPEFFSQPNLLPVPLNLRISTGDLGMPEGSYFPTASIVAKRKVLTLTHSLPFELIHLPYRIRCTVENHGLEASEAPDGKMGNHFKDYSIYTKFDHTSFKHVEPTAYKGLHYLKIKATKSDNTIIFERNLGIFIS